MELDQKWQWLESFLVSIVNLQWSAIETGLASEEAQNRLPIAHGPPATLEILESRIDVSWINIQIVRHQRGENMSQ